MSNELLKFIKHELIGPTVASTPSMLYGIVIGKGTKLGDIETVNVKVVYGNPDAPTHYNPNGEIFKNVPITMPGSGAISINLKEEDRVLIGFINGDESAPYILSAPKTTSQVASVPGAGVPIEANEEVESLGTADASFTSQDLKTISSAGDFTNLIQSIHNNIGASSVTATWDPACRIYIDIAHDDADLGDTGESSFPERDINLIMGMKLKEFLISSGAHKDSIKTSRRYTETLNYGTIVDDIYKFNPTLVIGIHSAHIGGTINQGISALALGNGKAQNALADNIKSIFSEKFSGSVTKINKNSASSGSPMCEQLIIHPNYKKYPASYLEFYYFNLATQYSKIDTVKEIYDVSLALTHAISRTLGAKEIKTSSTGSSNLVEAIIKIIFLNETSNRNYSAVTGNDNGAASLGAAQWREDRAVNILLKVKAKNPTAFANLSSALQNELNGKPTWKGRILNSSEVNEIKTFLQCAESGPVQESQLQIDANAYITNAKVRGVTDSKATVYMADIDHQYGVGGCNRLYAKTKLSNPSLDQLHTGIKQATSEYHSRRDKTYKNAKALNI